MADRLAEIQEQRGMLGVVAAAMDAREKYVEGIVCQCDEPVLVGFALMCRHCLLENMGQRERRETAMREPHEFQESKRGGLPDMCGFCSAWRDDPRHGGGSR